MHKLHICSDNNWSLDFVWLKSCKQKNSAQSKMKLPDYVGWKQANILRLIRPEGNSESTKLPKYSLLWHSEWLTVPWTSNVTGCHRGPKRKLPAGYRAPSRHAFPMCRQSYVCPLDVPGLRAPRIFHRWVWYHKFSLCCTRAMCIFVVRT